VRKSISSAIAVSQMSSAGSPTFADSGNEARVNACPAPDRKRAMSSTAAPISSFGCAPPGAFISTAILSGPVGTSSARVNAAPQAGNGMRDTLSGPAVTSSIVAVSRTLRVSTCSQSRPPASSSRCGPTGTHPRLGFNPTSPHTAAGTRIDPPESVP